MSLRHKMAIYCHSHLVTWTSQQP